MDPPQYLRASGFALDTGEHQDFLPHRAARFNEKGHLPVSGGNALRLGFAFTCIFFIAGSYSVL
jgi:hypothetical protein